VGHLLAPFSELMQLQTFSLPTDVYLNYSTGLSLGNFICAPLLLLGAFHGVLAFIETKRSYEEMPQDVHAFTQAIADRLANTDVDARAGYTPV